MFYLVLAIALLNIGIGYAVGVYWRNALGHGATPLPSVVHANGAPPEDEGPESIVVAVQQESQEIPESWHDILEDVGESASFIEAAVHVFKLELGKYRDQLIAIDHKVRICIKDPDETLLVICLDELKDSNESYLSRQDDARSHLTAKQTDLGELSNIGTQLEDVLLEQAAQIETAVSNVDVLDFKSDISEGCRRLLMEIDKLLHSCHALRDQMHEALLSVVIAERRLSSLSEDLRTDDLTGLANLTGLEVVIQSFRDADPQNQRVASVALFDIDGLAAMNRAHGPRFGDQLIEACGRAIAMSMRKKRGSDVTARFDGQRFLLFVGDTGPRNATSAAERIRQTIEQSTFVFQGLDLEVSVSCGVTELSPDESTKEAFRRAGKAATAAQTAGRNRTFLDLGNGPEPVEHPDIRIAGHTITLDD